MKHVLTSWDLDLKLNLRLNCRTAAVLPSVLISFLPSFFICFFYIWNIVETSSQVKTPKNADSHQYKLFKIKKTTTPTKTLRNTKIWRKMFDGTENREKEEQNWKHQWTSKPDSKLKSNQHKAGGRKKPEATDQQTDRWTDGRMDSTNLFTNGH